MKWLQTFNIWIITLLVFSSFLAACDSSTPAAEVPTPTPTSAPSEAPTKTPTPKPPTPTDISTSSTQVPLLPAGCPPECSYADLSGFNLTKTDLSRANLKGANLSGAVLVEANLSRANLHGANLREVNFQQANLFLTTLSDSNLSGANLRGANMNETFLVGANLRGANLRGANLSQAKLQQAVLDGVEIDDTTQIDDKWRLVWEIINHGAEGRNLSNTNLSEANLGDTNLSGADLHGSRLRKTNLSQANLSQANLSGTNLTNANLSEANLSQANLSQADLRDAILPGVNLSQANLNGSFPIRANLSGADLRDANLSDANLRQANLNQANLEGADLAGANLIKTSLMGANLIGVDDAGVFISRGVSYYDSGDLEQALADYTKALELNPDLADAYYNRGNAYHVSGELELAIMDYTKVIELDPDYIDAYYNRGNAYHSTFVTAYLKREVTYADSADDLKQVIRDFERYLELAPNDAPERGKAINIIEDLKGELAPPPLEPTYNPVPRYMLVGLLGSNLDILGQKWQYFSDNWGDTSAQISYEDPSRKTQLSQTFVILEEGQTAEDLLGPIPPEGYIPLEAQNNFDEVGEFILIGTVKDIGPSFFALIETEQYLYSVEITFSKEISISLQEFYNNEVSDLFDHVLQVSLEKSRIVPLPTATPLSKDQQYLYDLVGHWLITEQEANEYYYGVWEFSGDYVDDTQGTICRNFSDRTNADVPLVFFSNCIIHVGPDFDIQEIAENFSTDELLESKHNYPGDFVVYGVGRAPISYLAFLLNDEFLFHVDLKSRSFPGLNTEDAFDDGFNDEFIYNVLMTNLKKRN